MYIERDHVRIVNKDLEHVILSNDRDPFVVIVLHKYVRPPPPTHTQNHQKIKNQIKYHHCAYAIV